MPKRDDDYMQARREEILDAATVCLTRTGIAGLSTTAICEQAQISMGALYTHFKTKYDILAGLTARQGSRSRQKFSVTTEAELRRELLAIVKKLDTKFERISTRIDMELLSAAANDRRLDAVLEPVRADRSLADALIKLKALGELPGDLDAEASARAIRATLLGMQLLVLIGGQSAKANLAAMNQLLDGLFTSKTGKSTVKKRRK